MGPSVSFLFTSSISRAQGPEKETALAEARRLNEEAVASYLAGKYSQAEALIERSLAIWEKALGLEHPHVAISLKNLAVLYESQGKYAEAEPVYTRAAVSSSNDP